MVRISQLRININNCVRICTIEIELGYLYMQLHQSYSCNEYLHVNFLKFYLKKWVYKHFTSKLQLSTFNAIKKFEDITKMTQRAKKLPLERCKNNYFILGDRKDESHGRTNTKLMKRRLTLMEDDIGRESLYPCDQVLGVTNVNGSHEHIKY